MLSATAKYIAIFAIASSFCVPCRAGFIAHYTLDDTADDSSGNGFDGTIHGAAATTNRHGDSNSALFFDGVDDYVDIGQQLLFNGDDFTIAFWAKSAGAQNQYSVMVSQGHHNQPGGLDKGIAFQYGYPGTTDTIFIFGNTDGVFQWSNLPYPVDLEQDLGWRHYAVTKSGTSLNAYLDGVLSGSTTSDIDFGAFNFVIGRDFANADANHRTFYGAIDDVMVFDTALSHSEIQALQVDAVPEPTSLALLGLAGVVGVGLRRRQLRNEQNVEAA